MILIVFGVCLCLSLLWVVGPTYGGDGSQPAGGRQSRDGASVIAQGQGKYQELASRGLVFAASDQGAGVTVQVTITTTATLTLHNPANSKVRLSILKVGLGYFTGTMGAGSWYHAGLPAGNTLPSSGTGLTANCTSLSNKSTAAASGVAKAGATVIAATSGANSFSGVLWPFASSFPQLASTANPFQVVNEDINGLIDLLPGDQYQLVGVFGGTGSTPKVSPAIIWAEIPLLGAA